MPLVSFVIPCYRQAHFLLQAVSSVLAQSEPDVEAIVVDDGSPDDPAGALNELHDDPRLVVIRQENKGLGAARNRGIEASSGEYLAFLDSDDWLAPEFAAELLAPLRSDASLSFAYCDLEEVFEGTGRRLAKAAPFSVGRSRTGTSGDILPALLCGGYFTPNTVLVRAQAVKDLGGFAPELGGHADYDLWLRLAASGHLARYVDRRLAYYRIHGDNMSLDLRHMAETRQLALVRLARAFPARVAQSLEELMRLSHNLHATNLSLQDQLIELDRIRQSAQHETSSDGQSAAEYFRESQAWILELQKAVQFHQDQASYWRQQAESWAARVEELEGPPGGLGQDDQEQGDGPAPAQAGAAGEP
ncbi:MAG: glycosyltransferase [Acidobacteria bacterium]|nr:glycosyltransferase [Acidobacteriota bacterium]